MARRESFVPIMFLAVGSAAAVQPRLAVGACLLIVAGLLLAVARPRGEAIGVAALAVAWIPFPDAIPRAFEISGHRVYFADVLLTVALFVLLPRRRNWLPLVLLAVVAVEALRGFTESGMQMAITDGRGIYYLVCSYVIGSTLDRGILLRAVGWIVTIGAVLTVGSAVTGARLAGRLETVANAQGYQFGATRYLTTATHLGLAVLVVGITLAVVDRRPDWRVGAAAAAITFLSFSRNSLLGLGAGFLFAVGTSGRIRSFGRAGAAITIIAVSLYAASAFGSSIPFASNLAPEVAAYRTRVVDGLSSAARAQDSSIHWRGIESGYARAAFKTSPVIGHGIGSSYRPQLGPTGTFLGDGRYYIHNGYWWLLLKLGLLGFAVFAVLAGRSLRQAVGTRDPINIALAAGAACLLAVNFVAPMVSDIGGAPALGLLLGMCGVRVSSTGK